MSPWYFRVLWVCCRVARSMICLVGKSYAPIGWVPQAFARTVTVTERGHDSVRRAHNQRNSTLKVLWLSPLLLLRETRFRCPIITFRSSCVSVYSFTMKKSFWSLNPFAWLRQSHINSQHPSKSTISKLFTPAGGVKRSSEATHGRRIKCHSARVSVVFLLVESVNNILSFHSWLPCSSANKMLAFTTLSEL